MKKIVSISLGPRKTDYQFETEFLGLDFQIKRMGTDNNVMQAAELMREWDGKADVIGLGDIKFPLTIGSDFLLRKDTEKLLAVGRELKTPVTIGAALRRVVYEWSLRHINFKIGKGNYFRNAKVLFLSGISSYQMAKVMSEYTDNMVFADPLLENGIPRLLTSLNDLEKYSNGSRKYLQRLPSKQMMSMLIGMKNVNHFLLEKAVKDAHIIVIPYQNFHQHVENFYVNELGGKTVISSTVYDDRMEFLKERGVEVIIDMTPKMLEQVVGLNILEAMIVAALGRPLDQISDDDLLEIVSEQRMDPRMIYPFGKVKKVNRFAFVIHPLSSEYFKKLKALDVISKATPPGFMRAIEKVAGYMPPFLYSKVTGIKSPEGIEAEGWLISVGGTPREMLSKSPEVTYKQLLQAAKMAKRLGAQIMGLGAFTKVVGDAGVTVSRMAEIPITTGNSYSASAALWAAMDAVRRMGLIPIEKGKKVPIKAMVIGASGAIGAVCARLLAQVVEELHMVDVRDARLLALKEMIMEDTPDAKIMISTRADKCLSDMDVIVTATSAAGKAILDIMKVKPGCVITDVARPLDLSAEDVAKRPDVLVVESGEIELPGNPEMRDIGLPPKIGYACLAEVIVLTLEGRFETFTIGREIEWQKVKEIYKLGLKHGMRLAAISGVNGIFSDEDIKKVGKLALEARKG